MPRYRVELGERGRGQLSMIEVTASSAKTAELMFRQDLCEAAQLVDLVVTELDDVDDDQADDET